METNGKRYSLRKRCAPAILAKAKPAKAKTPKPKRQASTNVNATTDKFQNDAIKSEPESEPESMPASGKRATNPVIVKLEFDTSTTQIKPAATKTADDHPKEDSEGAKNGHTREPTTSENSSAEPSAKPESSTKLYEEMFKKLFKKSPRIKARRQITSAACFPYAYYRNRKSSSISAKNVHNLPSERDGEEDDGEEGDDPMDYLDWQPSVKRVQGEVPEALNKSQKDGHNGEYSNKQASLPLAQITAKSASGPASKFEPMSQNGATNNAGLAEKNGKFRDTSEMMETEMSTTDDGNPHSNYDSNGDDDADEDDDPVLFAQVTLGSGYSFDDLYDFRSGSCTCKRCQRRPELLKCLARDNLVQDVLASSQAYPNLTRLMQLLMSQQANNDLSEDSNNIDPQADRPEVPAAAAAAPKRSLRTVAVQTDDLPCLPPLRPASPNRTNPVENDTNNPNKVVILKKDLGNGRIAYQAVPQGSLATKIITTTSAVNNNSSNTSKSSPPTSSFSKTPEKQQFIKFVSAKPLPKISTNSLVKTADTLGGKQQNQQQQKPPNSNTPSVAPISYSKLDTNGDHKGESSSTNSQQVFRPENEGSNAEQKRIRAEQLSRIRKVSKQIASAMSKTESGEGELPVKGADTSSINDLDQTDDDDDDSSNGPLVIDLGEQQESASSTTTVYLPDSQPSKKRPTQSASGSARRLKYVAVNEGENGNNTTGSSTATATATPGFYEEEEFFELSYTTGIGKTPLIITLFLKCPLEGCDRLFSARNDDGHTVNIHYQIREHLAATHGISESELCLLCKERFPKDQLKFHVRSTHETGGEAGERFRCGDCPPTLTPTFLDCYEKLVKHYSKKHMAGRFMCAKEGCEHIATFKNDIYRHLAKAHHEHKCHQCGLTFQYQSTLQRHLQAHSDNYKYVCRYGGCHFSTNTKGGCLQHVRVRHLGLPLTRKGDPQAEEPSHAALEKKAQGYVYFLNVEENTMVPANSTPRYLLSKHPKGPIRTIRKKVLVMKKAAKEEEEEEEEDLVVVKKEYDEDGNEESSADNKDAEMEVDNEVEKDADAKVDWKNGELTDKTSDVSNSSNDSAAKD